MEENAKPSDNVEENVLPKDEEADGTSSYSLERARTEPNIHVKQPCKRNSLPLDVESSEVLGTIYTIEEDLSWPDLIPEERESEMTSNEPLDTYTMETHQDFSNFYDFLKGTTGEKYWQLWVNIDRIKLVKTDIQKQMLIVKINENFAKISEKSSFQRKIRRMFKKLDLNNCSEEEIKDLQALLLQPLMLYWLPHYLLISLMKLELSKYPSYASLLNNKRKLWSSITCEEIREDMEVTQTPRIYMVETKEKEAPESKLFPPDILRLPPQMQRTGMRRTHLLTSLKNCGNYGNTVFNNLEKTKKKATIFESVPSQNDTRSTNASRNGSCTGGDSRRVYDWMDTKTTSDAQSGEGMSVKKRSLSTI
ncbi:Hypothetical predicted protein [Octopus vulgaris]|uniref:Uncharacterized protein n=1 Tax=Octopus vulgaris TaxID=6645 RepID=A0AA36FJ63_OCTVU|nr:Hypothetical predicted protein [Octopus vulgaris]